MQVELFSIVHCSYETVWSETNYKGGSQEFLVVDLRNFRDPYIRASSITQGCTTLHTRATTCFPTDSQADISTLKLASQILLVAIIVTIVEVLVSDSASPLTLQVVLVFFFYLLIHRLKQNKPNTTRLVSIVCNKHVQSSLSSSSHHRLTQKEKKETQRSHRS